MIAVFTCLVLWAESVTAAETTPKSSTEVQRLPETVVTATGMEENPSDVPYSVNTVEPKNLEMELPRTLPESLKQTPSVVVQKTAHGQGSPFIRGFTGFRTLMLIDGVRLNNSVFREGPNQYWNTVDVFAIDRLEVVKGPSSVLYGSDAIGGTVNAITRRRDEFDEGLDWGGRLFYRVASAENSHTVRREASTSWKDKIGFLGGVTWKDYGNLRGGHDAGLQPKTGYNERAWDAKVEYLINPDAKFVLAHQTVDQDDAWRTHRTIFGVPWEGTTIGTDRRLIYDQDRELTYLQYHAQNIGSFVDEVHINVSHHLQAEDEHRVRSNSQSQRQGLDVNTLGTFVQLHSPSPIGRWVYGVEFYCDWVNSYSTRFNADGTVAGVDIQGPVGDDATYDLAGVYVQDTVDFGERVEATIGGRYTYAAAQADKVRDPVSGTQTSVSDSWDALVGSVRLICRLDEAEHWNVFGGVSQGFRAPNLSDLTRFDIAASGELETPAPNLDPEYYVSHEIGFKATYERGWAQAAYYYTIVDGMIVRAPTGNVVNGANEVTKRNSGNGYIHGVELSGEVELSLQWRTRAALSWMEGEVDQFPTSAAAKEREPASRMMPTTIQLGLLWEHPSKKYWSEAVWTGADKQNQLSSADERDTQRIPPGGTPGYSVYTLRAGWRPCRNVSLTAAIENLTDEDYRVHGSGLNEPGRNFVFALDLRY